MNAESQTSRLGRVMFEWYSRNPDVRRLWVYAATDPDRTGDVRVVISLAPVCDSDDISPIWLARCTGWQEQLEGLLGRAVTLDALDGHSDAMPCGEERERSRVCLAAVSWRD